MVFVAHVMCDKRVFCFFVGILLNYFGILLENFLVRIIHERQDMFGQNIRKMIEVNLESFYRMKEAVVSFFLFRQ